MSPATKLAQVLRKLRCRAFGGHDLWTPYPLCEVTGSGDVLQVMFRYCKRCPYSEHVEPSAAPLPLVYEREVAELTPEEFRDKYMFRPGPQMPSADDLVKDAMDPEGGVK